MSNKRNQNKPIRLVHVISSLKIGGAEAVLVDLVEQLRSRHFEQHVIYFYDGPNVGRIRALGIPVYQVKGLVCLYDPIFFVRLYRLLRKLMPDCIHALLWAANFAGRVVSRIIGIPIICGLHSVSELNGSVRMILDRFLFLMPQAYVAISSGVKQSFCQHWQDKQLPPVHIIRNGIDIICSVKGCDHINRQQLGFSNNHFIIGSVGRFIAVKNYDIILEQGALIHAMYKQTRMILVGTGPYEHYLRQKVHELGMSNETVFITEKRAISYYSLFDCFVLASYVEDHPLVLLEAMSFCLPCVVASVTGEHMVIKDADNGLIAGPNRSFEDALCLLIEQPALRESLGIKARQTVQEQFSLECMVESYSKLFIGLSNRV